MVAFRTGRVDRVLSRRPGLQRVEVAGEPAYVLTDLIGDVNVGDDVVINTPPSTWASEPAAGTSSTGT